MRGFRSWEKKWWNACTSARIQRRLELVPWRKNTEKKITKFGVFQQKIYCSKTKESWINKTQDHSDHRLCQGMLAILYPEVDEGERRILSRIILKKKLLSLCSLSVPPTSAVVVPLSTVSQLSKAAPMPKTSVPSLTQSLTVSSSISDASFKFSQRHSSSTFQWQLHCKYSKPPWAIINRPSQLFASGMSDRWDFASTTHLDSYCD